MGRNVKTPRAYNFVVTGIDADGQRFRLETNAVGMAKSLVPWSSAPCGWSSVTAAAAP